MYLCLETEPEKDPELIVVVEGEGIGESEDDSELTWAYVAVRDRPLARISPSRLEHRELLPSQRGVRRDVVFHWANVPRSEGLEAVEEWAQRIDDVRFTFTLRKPGEECLMNAAVSGDVNGYYYGDYAYFHTRDVAVAEGMMAGTLADEGMHEQLEGLVGMFGAMAKLAEEQGFDAGLTEEQRQQLGLDPEVGPVDETADPRTAAEIETEQALEEMLRPPDGQGGDNFGLSLAALRHDAVPEGPVGAAATFLSAFTLTLSGSAGAGLNQAIEAAQQIPIAVSTLSATLGAAEGRGAIKFGIPEGGHFEFQIKPRSENLVVGELVAQLETDSVYTMPGVAGGPRKLKALVRASFQARRGFGGCLR